MSLALANKIEILKDRASQFSKVREFFAKRGVYEVDVPMLSRFAPVDLHIDLVEARCKGHACYLHSSPEYGMKRLLAGGSGDIYQLSHVFRDDEVGACHNPEFTMLEWYRHGFSLEEMIEETLQVLRLFVEEEKVEILSYEEAFIRYTGKPPQAFSDRDEAFAFDIEPHLGRGKWTVLRDFPAEDAALSQTKQKGNQWVAERFEILFNGMELANGYHELTDAEEHERRFAKANRERKSLNKNAYPVDIHFLEALRSGIADCCGVAVGFDRLMMLRHQAVSIEEVIPLAWSHI